MANFLDLGTPIKDTVNAFTQPTQSLVGGMDKYAPKTNFWDGVQNFGTKASKYMNNGFDWLNDNSETLGAVGGLAQGYMEYDMANKQYDMQQKAFNYNKMLSDREKRRQEEAENSFELGFQNSDLSKG